MCSCERESDFEFYLRFVKPLIFNLQEPRDRALAAAWVQTLMNTNQGSEDLRTTYLKLLLFVLQRRKLRGIFLQNPNRFEGLEPFSEASLDQAARELLATENDLQDSPESGDFPPYCTEYSQDLLEYSAVQYIPNFGVHAYYAISNEPLPTWNRIDKAVFPRGYIRRSTTQIKVTESRQTINRDGLVENEKVVRQTTSKSVIILESQADASVDRTKHNVRYNVPVNQTYAPRRNNLTNISQPLGVQIKQEREAPVWGTNLVPITKTPAWEPPIDMLEADLDSLCYEEVKPRPCSPIKTHHRCGCPVKSLNPTRKSPRDMSEGAPHSLSYNEAKPKKEHHSCGCPVKSSRKPPTDTVKVASDSNEAKPCPHLPKNTHHTSPCPVKSSKRPASAATRQKDDYYFSEYQTSYLQANSLSNLVETVQTVPTRNPVPKRKPDDHFEQNRRMHSFDIPGEGEIGIHNPGEEFAVQMPDSEFVADDECTYDLPYEGQFDRQIPQKQPNHKPPPGFARQQIYPQLNQQIPSQPRQQATVQDESEIRVLLPMNKRNFISAQSRSGFVDVNSNQMLLNTDEAGPSDAVMSRSTRIPTLPSIPESQQALYNLSSTNQGRDVHHIIKQTLYNTQRIEQNLEAFDKFISDYETKESSYTLRV